MFKGLSPWLAKIAGRVGHTKIVGCTGLCRRIGVLCRDALVDRGQECRSPNCAARNYPEKNDQSAPWLCRRPLG